MVQKSNSKPSKFYYVALFPMLLFPAALGYYYEALSVFIIVAIMLPFLNSNRSFVLLFVSAAVANLAFFLKYTNIPGFTFTMIIAATLLITSLIVSANREFDLKRLLGSKHRNDQIS